MICNGAGEPMCFGGVFGGLDSGVTAITKRIFLESAWFNPLLSGKHRSGITSALMRAARFEKGVDISNTVAVLQQSALLIKEFQVGKSVRIL